MKRSLFTLAQRSQRETLRHARNCAGLLAAVAVIAFAGAPQVRAQAVGFVWNNNPTTAGTTTPDTAYSYNSSGGAISITRNAVGNYTAIFAGLGNGLNSNVVVSGYGSGADFCIVENWFSTNGTDVDVNVLCYNKAGNLADHSFTALYQARTHGDPTTPTVAFLWANEPTAPSYTPDLDYQYNPGGGTNTIVRTSTGNYTATLPGLTQTGGTVIVTAYGSAPAHCQVTDLGQRRSGHKCRRQLHEWNRRGDGRGILTGVLDLRDRRIQPRLGQRRRDLGIQGQGQQSLRCQHEVQHRHRRRRNARPAHRQGLVHLDHERRRHMGVQYGDRDSV